MWVRRHSTTTPAPRRTHLAPLVKQALPQGVQGRVQVVRRPDGLHRLVQVGQGDIRAVEVKREAVRVLHQP